MPTLAAITADNKKWKTTFRPVIVAAGGTGGIGAAIATAFVKYSPKDAANSPYVIIVGRSRDGANTVIEEMTSLNPAGKYEFIQGDLSLMSSVRAVAKEVTSKVDKVNFLVLTAGMLGLGKNDTSEGNDMKLCLDFYSRFLLTNLLLPQLEKAAEAGEEARVLTCLAAGLGGNIDLDDLGCRDNKGLKAKADSGATYNDLMVKEFSIRHPKVSFTHVYPGFVKSNIFSGFPFYLRWPLMIMQPFSSAPEDCAEYMIHHLTRPDHKTGGYYVSNNGDDAVKNKYLEQADIRQKVWDHGTEVTGLEDKK